MRYPLLLPSAAQAQDLCPVGTDMKAVSPFGPTPAVPPLLTSETNVTRTVPVFVHVVDSTSAQTVGLALIQQQIDVLNERFDTAPSGWDPGVPRYQFELVGMDRVVNADWANNITLTLAETTGEFAMKELLAVDPGRVLNVYVSHVRQPEPQVCPVSGCKPPVPGAEVNCYAYFPFPTNYGFEVGVFPEDDSLEQQFESFWGISLHPRTLPGRTYVETGVTVVADGTTLAHEVGHYLGLYHIREGDGCLPAGNDCQLSGDFVCDTPVARNAPSGPRTCAFQQCAGEPTPITDNAMYIAPNSCRQTFTNAGPPAPGATIPSVGQIWRMAIMGAVYKPALGEPGVLPTLPSVPPSQQTGDSYTTVVERRLIGGTWATDPAEDLLVEAPLVIEPGVEVRVAPGRRIVARAPVTGGGTALAATGATLTAADAALGWDGLRFEKGAVGALSGVTLSGVVVDDGCSPGKPCFDPSIGASLTAVNATVTVSGGQITDGQNAHGVHVLGGKAVVAVTAFAQVTNNSGYGVLASGGARTTIGDNSVVTNNTAGGVVASGYGSRATVTGFASADQNGGPGVAALANAHAVVRSPTSNNDNTSVSSNGAGGAYARSGGSLDGSQCEPYGATGRPTVFNANNQTGPFDASARLGSVVSAPYAFWNGRGAGALAVDLDGSSTVAVSPTAATLSTPDPFCQSISGNRGVQSGGTGAVRGTASPEVVALAASARAAAWRGDAGKAFAVLDAAADVAATDDDRAAVFEAAAELLAAVPTTDHPGAFVESLASDAASNAPTAPWAARALVVAYAGQGRAAEAAALAGALSARSEPEHARAGHALGVRLAVDAGDAAGATARLAAFGAAAADSASVAAYRAARSVVAATFPEADLSALPLRLASRGGTDAIGKNDLRETPALANVSTLDTVVDGLDVWPNPTSAQATARLTLSAEATAATVTLYDALGRRVAVLHAGSLPAGRHAFDVETAALPTGVYSAVARVSSAHGGEWTTTARFTIAR